jgi:hypothetical protein
VTSWQDGQQAAIKNDFNLPSRTRITPSLDCYRGQPASAHRSTVLDDRGLRFWIATVDSDIDVPLSCNPDFGKAQI